MGFCELPFKGECEHIFIRSRDIVKSIIVLFGTLLIYV